MALQQNPGEAWSGTAGISAQVEQFFFTVTLVDRTSQALTDHVDALRTAMKETQRSQPFTIDAAVILPNHLHIVMTLPEGDADYPNRWRLIKRRFTERVMKSGAAIARHSNGELSLWQRRYWEHTIRDESDFERHVDYIHFNPVRHGLVGRVAIGQIPRFTAMCSKGFYQKTGPGISATIQQTLANGGGDPQ